MSHHSLIIADLPHLEEVATNGCLGGFADASTATYAGPGVAVAVATATASGQTAITRTGTNALVRQTPRFTFSRATAWAVAISVDGLNVSRDISFSQSFYIAPN
ncbi:MAG: hypothetical protein F6K28_46720 [Microcoleus sp. SIO2G3]|nr:hypothetical protein [Microcoleus sp. SIO2G3]